MLPGLSYIGGKTIVARFDAACMSSDGRLLALREVEQRLAIAQHPAACTHDPRDPGRVVHGLDEIIRTRMLMIAAGYEDGNDADPLHRDPIFKLAMGRLPSNGDLSSQPTILRLENLPEALALFRMGRAVVDHYCHSFRKVPRRIVLDIDQTFDALHRGQQLRLFNAHYAGYGFQPIVVFDRGGPMIAAVLRPASRPSGRARLRRERVHNGSAETPKLSNESRSTDHYLLIHHQEFRFYFAGRILSLAGSSVMPVGLAFSVLQRGHGAGALGLIEAAYTIPLLVFILAGGVLADKMSRRSLVVYADMLRFFLQLILAVAVILSAPPVWAFCLLAIGLGFGEAMFNPADAALLPEIIEPEQLAKANSALSVGQSVLSIAGPGVAGIVASVWGPGWLIGVDALSYALSAVCVSRLKSRLHFEKREESFLKALRAGWDELLRHRWLCILIVQFSLLNLFYAAPMLVWGPSIFRLKPAVWGIILAAGGAGAVVGGMTSYLYKPGRPLLIAELSLLVYTLPGMLIASHALPQWVIGAEALAGLALTVGGIQMQTVIQSDIPLAAMSRVTSYLMLGSLSLAPIALVLSGPAAVFLGQSEVIWIGVAVVVVGVIAALSRPSIRRYSRASSG